MSRSELEKYKEYVSFRLRQLAPLLQKYALGDFSKSIEVPEEEDEFTELMVGMNLMKDDIKELTRAQAAAAERAASAANKLNKAIMKVARGDYSVQIEVSDNNDAFDSIALGLNMMVDDIRNNIMERERAEEAMRIKDKAISNSINAIAMGDLKGNLTYINGSFLRMWGFTDEKEVLKRSALEFWQAGEKVAEVMKALTEKGSWLGELVAKKNDGTLFDVQLSGSMVTDESGNPICMMASFIDITQRKRFEKALKEYAQKAEEANQKKTQFVSDVSHELRTPLAAIKGFTSTVRSDKDMDPDTREDFLKTVDEEADRLTRIINDLLDLSRIESGRIKLKKENIKLTDVIKKNVEVVRPQVEEKHLQLKAELPDKIPFVLADSDKISQVIINLLGNAVKYTKRGKVSISAQEEDGHVKVEVADTGVGIDKDDLSKVFDKFMRIEKTESEEKGTGLGLSIVKALVEIQGGEVFVESELGKGSKFGFRLPAVK
jgi:PAS domain S-box-containing protein